MHDEFTAVEAEKLISESGQSGIPRNIIDIDYHGTRTGQHGGVDGDS